MRVISTAGVDAALSMPRLIDALADAFCSDMVVPLRHHHTISRHDADATLLLMPAWTGAGASKSYLGTKTVTVFPANSARHLPSIFGSYLLLDGTSGVPLATMDGARLTVWRTAAASALAARSLVREDAESMVMVGAGALALILGALGFQYLQHLPPCEMCHWQRWPHIAAAALGLIGVSRSDRLAIGGNLMLGPPYRKLRKTATRCVGTAMSDVSDCDGI